MEVNSLSLIPNYFDTIDTTLACQSPTVEILSTDHGDAVPTTITLGRSPARPYCDRRSRGRPRKRPSSDLQYSVNSEVYSSSVAPLGRGLYWSDLCGLAAHESSLDDQLEVQAWYEDAQLKYYTETYQTPSVPPQVKRHRATYSANDAIQVLKYIEETKSSVRKTAKKFNIPKSTVQDIKKRGMPSAMSSQRGKHRPGAGRPVSYGSELDEQLLAWVLQCNSQHLLVTTKALKAKAVELISPQHPSFKASDSWVRHFLFRHSAVINSLSIQSVGSARAPVSLAEKMVQIGASKRQTRSSLNL